MAIQLHPSMPVHPGAWLKRNVVDHHGLPVSLIAKKLLVTRDAMSNLLHGHAALSPEMAIRFEKAFGIPADTMCRMQTAYDLASARAHSDDIKVDYLELA